MIREYAREKKEETPPERIEGGLRLGAGSFTGGMGPMRYGWYCEPREAMLIGTEPSPRSHVMGAEFSLEEAPAAGTTLRIEGQNSDKDSPPLAHLSIRVNQEEVFSGPVDCERRGWSWLDFSIEPGILNKGRNTIEIRNMTDGPRVKYGRMDHFWFALSEARILFNLD